MGKRKQFPFVSDCIETWWEMAGTTNEKKRVNAYLTAQIILRYKVPSNECQTEATKIVLMFHKGDCDFVDQTARYLKTMFGIASDKNLDPWILIAKEVHAIIDGKWPPGFHTDPLRET